MNNVPHNDPYDDVTNPSWILVNNCAQQLELAWKKADIIATNAGLVLEGSARMGVEAWQDGHAEYLCLTGYNTPKRVAEMFELQAAIKYFGITRDVSRVRSQGLAAHTGEQANWLADTHMFLSECLSPPMTIALICPRFHLPRFYLTTLEALRRRYAPDKDYAKVLVTPVIYHQYPNALTLLNPAEEKAAGGESDDPKAFRTLSEAMQLPSEVARIPAYQQPKADGSPGDVLTHERLLKYVDWMSAVKD